MPKCIYFEVERAVYALVNALKADTVTIAEQSYASSLIVLADVVVKNAMFPPTWVRAEILNLEKLIVSQICRTEGHPRRVDFLVTQPRIHGQTLLSSIGGIGAVYEDIGGGQKLYYENRAIEIVEANRPDAELIDVGALNPRPERLWGWDGATLFLSTDETVTVELFDYNLTIPGFAGINAMFNPLIAIESFLGVEFQSAWECGAAGVLAAKVGTFQREASDYWEKFAQLMTAQGVQMRFDLDFASKQSQ